MEVTQDATCTAEGETQQENGSTEGKMASDSSANKAAGEDKSQQVASQEMTSGLFPRIISLFFFLNQFLMSNASSCWRA